MRSYIIEIKKQFRDKYDFKPKYNGVCDEPCFTDGSIPDGTYPMKIKGKTDYVRIIKGTISCCNFKKPKKRS